MGCQTDGSPQEFGTFNESHCTNCQPTGGMGVQFWTYPQQNRSYYWPSVDRDAVCYGSTMVTVGSDDSSNPLGAPAYCGKLTRNEGTGFGGFGSTSTNYRVWDHVPESLSFYPLDSDMYFAYMWETSDAFVGTPCKQTRLVTRNDTSSTTSEGPEDPVTGEPTTVTTTTTTSSSFWQCIPCTDSDGECTPTVTTVSYSLPEGNLTGNGDQPHPTIYASGTNRNTIIFKYNGLSTTQANSVDSFTITIDGNTYNAWSEGASNGEFTISAGTWGQDDFNERYIEEFSDANGFRYAISIRPNITDLTNDVYTYSGSLVSILEVISGGTGYSTSSTFSDTLEGFSWTLNVTSVVDREVAAGSTGTLISKGETVNGHTVVGTFHTDIENFIWHVLELDGNGSNFTKDGSYTTSAGRSITTAAGFGIPDRGMIVGLYEFPGKSIQFITAELDPEVPHVYDDLVEPNITFNVSNGVITSANIIDGGSGYDILGREVFAGVSPPAIDSGKQAVIDATFTNGSITAVRIVDGGSGYSSSTPPVLGIGDTTGHTEIVSFPGLGDPNDDAALNLQKEADDFNDLGKFDHVGEIKAAEFDFDGVSETVGTQTITGIRVKYSRPAEYKIPGTNYTQKGGSTLEYSKVFQDQESADAFIAEMKRQSYNCTTEKLEEKRVSELIRENKQDLQQKNKETLVGKVTKIDLSQTTSKEKYYEQKESMFAQQKITERKHISANVRTDPNVKRIIETTRAGLPQSAIDAIPRTTETPEKFAEFTPIEGLDASMKTALDNYNAAIDSTLDEGSRIVYDETEVQTVNVSFSRMPCASRFLKYYVRQYTPDSSTKTTMNISLTCTMPGLDCTDYCPDPANPTYTATPGVTTTLSYQPATISGGCQNFTASGSVDIYNDMTAASNTFVSATEAFGNPFDSVCN